MRREAIGLGLGLALIVCLPGSASAHLFHFANVRVRETQIARDFRLIKELIEWPDKHFELARKVYRGEIRRRGAEEADPGFLLKSASQRAFPSPPLKELVQAMDARHGTANDVALELAFDGQDEEGIKARLRPLFVFEIEAVLDAMGAHLDIPRISDQLFGVLTDYIFTAFEIHLALRNRPVYLTLRDAVGHLQETLSPGANPPARDRRQRFERERSRILALLRIGLAA